MLKNNTDKLTIDVKNNINMNKGSILKVINDCKENIEKNNYKSFDIFDALTAGWIDRITKPSPLLRRIAIQLNAKSPVNLHWLGMKRMQHTKTISDMLWLGSLGESDQVKNDITLEPLFNMLMSRRINGTSVWGLNFPYTTRFIDADRNMANLYNTCTTGIAIAEYCSKTGRNLEVLPEIYKDLCLTFNYINEGNKGFFIYYPGQKHPTYNVNALALFLFSKINEISGKLVVPKERLDEMIELIVDEQLEDGSWYYSRSDKGKWVDGFHSGFIIESLVYCYLHGSESAALKNAIDKAINFYVERMFTVDGYPKYFDYSGRFPIESQNCAQAIQTLAVIVEYGRKDVLPLLDKLVDNTIDTLYSGKGYFYYKKESFYTNKQSYFRWSTTPMLVALKHVCNLNGSN